MDARSGHQWRSGALPDTLLGNHVAVIQTDARAGHRRRPDESRPARACCCRPKGTRCECADSGEDAIAQIRHSAAHPALCLPTRRCPASPAPSWPTSFAASVPRDASAGDERKSSAGAGHRALRRISAEALQDGRRSQPLCNAHILPPASVKSAAKREKWTVIRGPAGRSSAHSQLISISASSAPQTASTEARQAARRSYCREADTGALPC